MDLINELLKGMVTLSIFAVVQHGCTVKEMAKKAANSHQKGLTSYGDYSRMLTGHQQSWAKPQAKKAK